MKYYIGLLLCLVGCGTSTTTYVQNAVPTDSPAPDQSLDVSELVAAQNAYRDTVGQDALSSGLTCTLYTVPTTTTAIIGATLTTIGSFSYYGNFDTPNGPVTNGLSILPTELQSVYQTWYIVKCSGYLVVADSNWHEFDVASDDGSNLYVDGLLINNDGLHAIQDKSASKFLAYGFHSFELDFFQGAGQQALILNEDNGLMSSEGFYH